MKCMYPACFYKEEDGYSVFFNDLNIATCGNDLEEAMAMAIDALAGCIYTLTLDGKEIPKPSDIKDVEIKLYEEATEGFKNMVYVDVMEYAKIHFTKSVKKTLTIPSWLNDLALRNNVNFSKVLQNALVEHLEVDMPL